MDARFTLVNMESRTLFADRPSNDEELLVNCFCDKPKAPTSSAVKV
jgi:hypothetical protein